MKNFSRSGRIISAGAALLVLLGVLTSAFYFHANSGAHAAAASPQVITPHTIAARPQYLYAGKIGANGGGFPCQAPGASVRCYGPSQIRAAYNVQQLINRGVTG